MQLHIHIVNALLHCVMHVYTSLNVILSEFLGNIYEWKGNDRFHLDYNFLMKLTDYECLLLRNVVCKKLFMVVSITGVNVEIL